MYTYSWPVAGLQPSPGYLPVLACPKETGKEDTRAPSSIMCFPWTLQLDIEQAWFDLSSFSSCQSAWGGYTETETVLVVLNQNWKHWKLVISVVCLVSSSSETEYSLHRLCSWLALAMCTWTLSINVAPSSSLWLQKEKQDLLSPIPTSRFNYCLNNRIISFPTMKL